MGQNYLNGAKSPKSTECSRNRMEFNEINKEIKTKTSLALFFPRKIS